MVEKKKISISELKQDLFAPYGRILEPKQGETPEVTEQGIFDFYVPFRVKSKGWQMGYLLNITKSIDKLERHPNTPEVFSPISGETVLVATNTPKDPSSIMGFLLTKPIVFNLGVWHGVITLSEKSEILIVENPDVVDEFYELPFRLMVE
ncbi:MAG: ureidoglycolate lyase [Spirochaetota bacterium]